MYDEDEYNLKDDKSLNRALTVAALGQASYNAKLDTASLLPTRNDFEDNERHFSLGNLTRSWRYSTSMILIPVNFDHLGNGRVLSTVQHLSSACANSSLFTIYSSMHNSK